MRAGLRLRMQRHHVGVAVHRVQHSGAQAARFPAAAPVRAARCRPQGASTQATSSASANTSAAAGIQ